MKRISKLLALLLALGVLLCACAPAAAPEETPAASAEATEAPAQSEAPEATEAPATEAPAADSEPQTVEEVLDKLREGLGERTKVNPPEVRTLESGVTVQRTPAGNDSSQRYADMPVGFNTYVYKADQRGCGACHANLEDTVDQYSYGKVTDYPHVNMHSSFGIEVTAMMCMDCHNYSTTIGPNARSSGTFGDLMHAYHGEDNAAFTAMGGNCWSCHYASADGMQLWDEVKHNMLRGITDLSADSMDGTFQWDQDPIVDRDDHFTFAWQLDEGNYTRWAQDILGMQPEPETDGVYDSWEFTIDGEVENPFTMTISQMLETFPLVKETMAFECIVNSCGGPLIANSEITGFDLADLLAYAGVKDDATFVCRAGSDYYQLPIEWIEKYGMYLVLELNGEPITYEQGYPIMLVSAYAGAFLNEKCITGITVGSGVEPSIGAYFFGAKHDDGIYYNNPNVALFHLREGQIFKQGEQIEFSGYAHALGKNVAAVELSFDRGNSWVTLPVENADLTKWVHWSYSWTPKNTGSYVIAARCVDDTGMATARPVEVLFNVQ